MVGLHRTALNICDIIMLENYRHRETGVFPTVVYASGQSEQTVNLSPSGFDGSNPSTTTNTRLRCIFAECVFMRAMSGALF